MAAIAGEKRLQAGGTLIPLLLLDCGWCSRNRGRMDDDTTAVQMAIWDDGNYRGIRSDGIEEGGLGGDEHAVLRCACARADDGCDDVMGEEGASYRLSSGVEQRKVYYE